MFTKEAVLSAINGWVARRGLPPTIEELRQQLGAGSTRTVLRYLGALEEAGLIERWAGARGLRALQSPRREAGTSTCAVPLVGEAPAGPLMAAEENREGWVQLPEEFLRPPRNRYYLLRVRGDSMNRASVPGGRIGDRDLVLVRQQASADPGDIVVILLDGQATIKRLVRAPGYWVLKPESAESKHRPIVITQDARVQGVVVRVLKGGAFHLE
jgi:repressor LexA